MMRSSKLKRGHINVRSIFAHLDVLTISETWLVPDVGNVRLYFLRLDQTSHAGSLAV